MELLNIISNIIFIPIYGISGAAFTTLISFLIILILNLNYLKNKIGVEIPIKNWAINLFISLLFLLVVIILKKVIVLGPLLELIIVGIISLIIYLLMLFLFKLINIKEIRKLISNFYT